MLNRRGDGDLKIQIGQSLLPGLGHLGEFHRILPADALSQGQEIRLYLPQNKLVLVANEEN